MLAGEAPEYPVDLGKIAGMVGARRQIQLARAAPKMGYRAGPAAFTGNVGKGLGVVAGRRTLKAVKNYQKGLPTSRRPQRRVAPSKPSPISR